MNQTATQEERFLSTCFHESGHCTMAWLMKRGPHRVQVFEKLRQEDQAAGITFMKAGLQGELNPKNEKDVLLGYKSILCILAGAAATLLQFGKGAGIYDDHEESMAILQMIKPGSTEEDLCSILFEAQEILAEPDVWGKLSYLADVLTICNDLGGKVVRDILCESSRISFPPREPVKTRFVTRGANQ